METNLPYFLNFPKDFRAEIVGEVARVAKKGINVQVVGLEGMGKSLIFRSMLAKDSNYCSVYGNLASKLEEFKQRGEVGVVLVDSAESETVKMVMPLYDQYRNYVSFVFFVEKEMLMKSSCNILYIKPWVGSDVDWFVRGLIEESEVKIDKTITDKIVKVSGGVVGIIKRLFELVVAGEEIDEVTESPWRYAKLAHQLELMGVSGNDEWLRKYYLVDSSGNFLSKIVENYVKHLDESKSYLTREENKVMKFLEKNRGKIVDREDLIVAIWGEKANAGISDHALDQLMHRLRSKVKREGVEIETVRGRGYVLR